MGQKLPQKWKVRNGNINEEISLRSLRYYRQRDAKRRHDRANNCFRDRLQATDVVIHKPLSHRVRYIFLMQVGPPLTVNNTSKSLGNHYLHYVL